MSREELLALAEKAEQATEESEQLFLQAGDAAFGPEPNSDYQPRRTPCFSPEWEAWITRRNRFRNLVQWGAWLDAAKLLLPDAGALTAPFWKVGNDGEGGDPALFKADILVAGAFTSKHSTGLADTAALALCAASLRARAADKGEL